MFVLFVSCRAQSGTGKTATFSISILQSLDTQFRETQALILSPTRELAGQIQKVWRCSSTAMCYTLLKLPRKPWEMTGYFFRCISVVNFIICKLCYILVTLTLTKIVIIFGSFLEHCTSIWCESDDPINILYI